MRTHLLVAVVAPLLTALGVTPSLAQQVVPTCAQDTPACMIQAATAYLDSIVNHDASTVPFAPDVKRTEQGRITAMGETAIRESQKLQPDMAGHVNTRFFVEESSHNVIAFTLLRVTGRKADPNRRTFSGVDVAERDPFTVHLAERFKVEKGLITEIEAIFYREQGTMDGLSNWADSP
jgi:hypothetical protein